MRKIINDADNVVQEMMEGYVSAYSRYYRKHPEVNGVILKQRRKDKVALVIGGGSGHEPMFSGFVGKGLADAAIYLPLRTRTLYMRRQRRWITARGFCSYTAAMRETI